MTKKDYSKIIKWVGIPVVATVNMWVTYTTKQFDTIRVYYFISDCIKVWIIWEIFLMFFRNLNRLYLLGKHNVEKHIIYQVLFGTIVIVLTNIIIQYAFYPLDIWLTHTSRIGDSFFKHDIIVSAMLGLAIQFFYVVKFLLSSDRKDVKQSNDSVFFISKIGNAEHIINIKDIIGFVIEHKNVFTICSDNKTYLIDMTLEKVYEKLNPDIFFRANRQIIISLPLIRAIKKLPNNRLDLILYENNHMPNSVIVSRSNTPIFRKWLSKQKTPHTLQL